MKNLIKAILATQVLLGSHFAAAQNKDVDSMQTTIVVLSYYLAQNYDSPEAEAAAAKKVANTLIPEIGVFKGLFKNNKKRWAEYTAETQKVVLALNENADLRRQMALISKEDLKSKINSLESALDSAGKPIAFTRILKMVISVHIASILFCAVLFKLRPLPGNGLTYSNGGGDLFRQDMLLRNRLLFSFFDDSLQEFPAIASGSLLSMLILSVGFLVVDPHHESFKIELDEELE